MKKSIKYLVFSALFAALIAVFTAFVQIPFGTGGYVHLGDTIVFIAAVMLPTPYAAVAAAIGGGLADVLAGAAVWAPASLVIKALLVLAFTNKSKKIICVRNFIACGAAVLITVAGYYVAEAIIYQNWVSPMLSVLWNVCQAVSSGVLFTLIAFALDKTKIKNKLNF